MNNADIMIDAAEAFVALVSELHHDDWDRPGLGVWDVRSLVGHTGRAVVTVLDYLPHTADVAELASAAQAYGAVIAGLTDDGWAGPSSAAMAAAATPYVDWMSATAAQAKQTALQAALIEETGFQSEQFARIHTGGAVGERLNHAAMK